MTTVFIRKGILLPFLNYCMLKITTTKNIYIQKNQASKMIQFYGKFQQICIFFKFKKVIKYYKYFRDKCLLLLKSMLCLTIAELLNQQHYVQRTENIATTWISWNGFWLLSTLLAFCGWVSANSPLLGPTRVRRARKSGTIFKIKNSIPCLIFLHVDSNLIEPPNDEQETLKKLLC